VRPPHVPSSSQPLLERTQTLAQRLDMCRVGSGRQLELAPRIARAQRPAAAPDRGGWPAAAWHAPASAPARAAAGPRARPTLFLCGHELLQGPAAHLGACNPRQRRPSKCSRQTPHRVLALVGVKWVLDLIGLSSPRVESVVMNGAPGGTTVSTTNAQAATTPQGVVLVWAALILALILWQNSSNRRISCSRPLSPRR
jgi:hypothetical protein